MLRSLRNLLTAIFAWKFYDLIQIEKKAQVFIHIPFAYKHNFLNVHKQLFKRT